MPRDEIPIKLTILWPKAPGAPAPDVGRLVPRASKPPPDARSRRLPVQPDEVPSGHVWVGPNDGFVPYSGVKPRLGDLIVVHGGLARRFVTSPVAHQPLRWPTFVGGCQCRCPDPDGITLTLAQVVGVAQGLVVDALTAELRQIVGANELGFANGSATSGGAAVTFDTVAPWDLYALDDLRGYQQWVNDQQTTRSRRYFSLIRWRVSGGQYAVLDRYALTDPYSPGLTDPTAPAAEPDPPAVEAGGSCLAVHDGVATVTLLNAPARYLRITTMSAQETRTLTRDGDPYDASLRGNLVQVTQTPGRTADRYVLARQGGGATTLFRLLRFNAEDAITGVVDLGTYNLAVPTPIAPVQVVVACNQLLVLIGQVAEEEIGAG